MNEFLRRKSQVVAATQFLREFGWDTNESCCIKDWDLAQILPCLRNGNILDMGAYGSMVLQNHHKKGLVGHRHGVDLNPNLVEYRKNQAYTATVCDLCYTPFDDCFFDTVTCLSVIEHEVNFGRFIKEVSRVLIPGGHLYATFDYWPDKYKGLPAGWNILCKQDVEDLLVVASDNHLNVLTFIDWTTEEAVVRGEDWMPVRGINYTFGALEFRKKIT